MVAARRRVSTDSEASDAATRESKRMRVEHVDSQPSQVIDSSDEEDLIQDDPSPLPADEDGYKEHMNITLEKFYLNVCDMLATWRVQLSRSHFATL